MWINTKKVKKFLVYLYRISLISGLILGTVLLVFGGRFFAKAPSDQITIKNAVAEQQKTETDPDKSLFPEESAPAKATELLTVLLAGIDRVREKNQLVIQIAYLLPD